MEGYIFCPRCGYGHRYSEMAEGLLQDIRTGYGVMCRGEGGHQVTFSTVYAVPDEEIENYQSDPNLVYLTRWNAEKGEVELLVGEYPPSEYGEDEEADA